LSKKFIRLFRQLYIKLKCNSYLLKRKLLSSYTSPINHVRKPVLMQAVSPLCANWKKFVYFHPLASLDSNKSGTNSHVSLGKLVHVNCTKNVQHLVLHACPMVQSNFSTSRINKVRWLNLQISHAIAYFMDDMNYNKYCVFVYLFHHKCCLFISLKIS